MREKKPNWGIEEKKKKKKKKKVGGGEEQKKKVGENTSFSIIVLFTKIWTTDASAFRILLPHAVCVLLVTIMTFSFYCTV